MEINFLVEVHRRIIQVNPVRSDPFLSIHFFFSLLFRFIVLFSFSAWFHCVEFVYFEFFNLYKVM